MTILSDRRPGFSVVRKLREVQAENGVTPNKLGRLFGVSPLHADGVSWFKGIKGELRVGALLDSLRAEGYVVLHSVPVGERGSDLDHVVVSLTGKVFVLNTKNHSGVKVVGYKHSVYVAGQNYKYFQKSLYEASRTRKLLGALVSNVEVYPALVFVGVNDLTVKQESDVKLVSDSGLLKWIRSVESGSVSESFDVSSLMVSSFWSPVVEEDVDQDVLFEWFREFDSAVSAARVRSGLWGFAALLGVMGVAGVVTLNLL